jgi:Na+/H+ antiporter NhaD/arsenite permease-like protein
LVAAVFFLAVAVVFRPKMRVTNERKARILDFDASRSLPDGAMLRPMMTILLAVLFGFVLANWISFPLALVAWAGAGALMLVVGPKEAMRQLAESDWDGLVFVGGLFVLVGGLVDSSLTAALVPELARFPLQILWGSALLSSLVDNVTAVTVLTPVLQALAGASGTHPVWLPLVLGGALGGGATLLGAWANLTAASIAGKSGYKLPFWAFTRYALIFALLNLFVVSGLLLLPTLAML